MNSFSANGMKTLLALCCLSTVLTAAPKSAQVVSGTAEVRHPSGHMVEVETGERAIINWKDFSIGVGETVRFLQPGSNSAVLNRVVGGDLSFLAGLLEANGRVYLVNPSGVIIGREAVINTGAFIASTLDLFDEQFLKGGPLSFCGDSSAIVVNYGSISGCAGDVLLLGRYVRNEGSINAPAGMAGLGVGQEILVKPEGEERLFIVPKPSREKLEAGIDNTGAIAAVAAELKADGNAYKLAINQTGIIEATGTVEREGRIYLVAEQGVNKISGKLAAHNADGKGGTVQLLGQKVGLVGNAKVDVSGAAGGGTVLIGGDLAGANPEILNAEMTVVEAPVFIDASATIKGDGGKIIAWSDKACAFVGTARAAGGPQGGDGGIVEASGKLHLNFDGLVNTAAPLGKTGQLLLDPTDVIILSNGGVDTNATFSNGTYTYTSTPAMLDNGKLSTNLTTSNVLITTNGNFSANGDITVQNGLHGGAPWNSSNSLTLQAARNVLFLDSVENDLGTGGLTVTAGGMISVVSPITNPTNVRTAYGAFNLNSGAGMQFSATNFSIEVGSVSGPVAVNCASDFLLQGSSTSINAIAQFDTSLGGAVFNIGGNLTVQGGTANESPAQIGIQFPGTSNMHFNVAGDVSVIGTTFTASDVVGAQIGNFSNGGFGPGNQSGNIHLNIGGDLLVQGSNSGAAQIGHSGTGSSGSQSGNIHINVAGDIDVIGGAQQGAAQIGHFGFQPNPFITSGDITINQTGGSLNLEAGVILSDAVIGFGNSMFDNTLIVQSGKITIDQKVARGSSDPGIQLTAGDQIANAIIGFGTGTILAGVSTVNAEGIFINSNGGVELTSGTGTSNAVIGYEKVFTNVVDLSIGLIEVNSKKDVALLNPPGALGDSLIGVQSQGDLVSTLTANIAVNARGNIVLQGSTNPANQTFIMNNQENLTDPLFINLQAQNILVGQAGAAPNTAEIFSSGDLKAIANVDVQLAPSALVHNGAGSVTLVVDNAFPKTPKLGPGKFVIQSGATLTAAGPLRIFTSKRSLNQIGAPLNGVTFVPGAYLVDSTTEKWGTYYPSLFGGFPYTIFYKEQIPSYLFAFGRAQSEFLQDLRAYDYPLFVEKCFLMGEECDEDAYRMMMPQYHNYELKHFEILP